MARSVVGLAQKSSRCANLSFKTPVIITSGINKTSTSAPTPRSLMIVLFRLPKVG